MSTKQSRPLQLAFLIAKVAFQYLAEANNRLAHQTVRLWTLHVRQGHDNKLRALKTDGFISDSSSQMNYNTA